MKKILLAAATIGITLISCGPSDEDVQKREDQRQKEEKQLDEGWEDDADDFFNEDDSL